MICNVQSPIHFFLWKQDEEQDEEQKECYKKIYQELVKSKWWDIKPLIEKCKSKILVRYTTTNQPRDDINVNFLSNLEDKISIEDISDSLNSFYWQDSN